MYVQCGIGRAILNHKYGGSILYGQSRRGFSRWGAFCARVAAAFTVHLPSVVFKIKVYASKIAARGGFVQIFILFSKVYVPRYVPTCTVKGTCFLQNNSRGGVCEERVFVKNCQVFLVGFNFTH